MSRWSADYEKSHKVRVNYRSIGSGAGLSELKQGLLTFAVSDAPLSDSQLRDLPALVQVPVTAGPVCVIYNLSGLNAPLRFSGKTLAEIYSGGIVSWQDPAIARENPGSSCPTWGSWSSIAPMAAEPPVSLPTFSAVSAQAGPQRSVMVWMSIGQPVSVGLEAKTCSVTSSSSPEPLGTLNSAMPDKRGFRLPQSKTRQGNS